MIFTWFGNLPTSSVQKEENLIQPIELQELQSYSRSKTEKLHIKS